MGAKMGKKSLGVTLLTSSSTSCRDFVQRCTIEEQFFGPLGDPKVDLWTDQSSWEEISTSGVEKSMKQLRDEVIER